MKNILFIIVIISMFGCEKPNIGYKLYFFPYDELELAKVYVYRNEADFDDMIYYALQSKKNGDKWYLQQDIYNNKYVLTETYSLQITGAVVSAYEYYALIDSSLIKMRIYSDSLFLWNMELDSKYSFEVAFNRPETRNQLQTKRILKLKSIDESIQFENVDYKSICLEQNEFINDGNNNISNIESKIYYSKGLGVSQIIIKNQNKIRTYKLQQILPYKQWKSIINNTNKAVQIL